MKQYQLIFLAVLSGVLLSLPWMQLVPGWILFIAFVPLLFVEGYIYQRKEQFHSFVFWGYAFLSFLVWNVLSTWWITYVSIVGMILIVTLNAIFMATIWWLFHQMKQMFGMGLGNVSLVVFWLAFEYLQYNWEIAWPWLSLGNGFANQTTIIQWYEFTGVLGGSLWVLVLNLALFRALNRSVPKFSMAAIPSFFLFLLLLGIPISISKHLYNHYQENGKSYNIAVLQPNVDPYTEKFGKENEEEQLNSLLHLADSLVTDSTDYIVAPETTIEPLWQNDSLMDNPQIVPFVDRVQSHPRLNFVLGAMTKKVFQPDDILPESARKFEDRNLYYDIYNSALQINHDQQIQIYHKSILVSGVEKMPFSKYFSFVEKFIVDLGGTTGSLGQQKEPSVFTGTSGLKVGPVICFESAFGQYVSKFVRKGAQMFFIITNDGWWKDSAGYEQHFSYARLRAIETRRSIARSGNTGVSAFINQRGDIQQATLQGVKTAIRGQLKANDKITFYTQYGDYIGRVSLFVAVLLLLYYFTQTRIRKTSI